MIKIYGSPMSSANRTYWLLEELGVAYERQPLDMMGKREHKNEAYLALNPNGKVPCLIDEGFVIWESMAINAYLAEKYQSDLAGNTPEERGLVLQWSYWAILEMQHPLVNWLIEVFFKPEDQRNPAVYEKSQAAVAPLLKILDDALEGKDYLVAGRFTLADLNVASVVLINLRVKNDISLYPHVNRWLQAQMARPAFQRVAALPR